MGVCKRIAIGDIGTSFYAWQVWGFLIAAAIVVAVALFYYNYIHVRQWQYVTSVKLFYKYIMFLSTFYYNWLLTNAIGWHIRGYPYDLYIFATTSPLKLLRYDVNMILLVLFGKNILRSLKWITEVKIFLDVVMI